MVGGGGVGGGEASRSFPNISSLWALFIVWVKSKRPSAYVGFCLRGMSPRQPQLAPIGGERAEDISISRHTASSAATTRAASVLAESVPLGRVSRLPSRGSSHGTAIVSRVTSSSSASTAPSTQLTPQLRSPSAEELQERVTAYAATLAARTRDLASSLSAGAALSAAFARGGGIFPDDAAIAAAATAGLKELGPISASLGWSASKAHARSPSFTSSGLSATLSPPHMGASATAARLALSSRAVSTPTSGRPGITGSRETSYSLESEKFCEKNGEGPSSFNSFDCHEQYCADAFDNGDLQRRENNGDDWPFSRKISVSTQAILSAREKDDYYRGEMPSESPLSPGAARETTERHESSAAFSAERQTKVSFAAHSLDPVKALSFKERLKSVKPKVFVRPRKPPEFAERVEQERREELLKQQRADAIFQLLEQKRKEYHDDGVRLVLEQAHISKARRLRLEERHRRAMEAAESSRKEALKQVASRRPHVALRSDPIPDRYRNAVYVRIEEEMSRSPCLWNSFSCSRAFPACRRPVLDVALVGQVRKLNTAKPGLMQSSSHWSNKKDSAIHAANTPQKGTEAANPLEPGWGEMLMEQVGLAKCYDSMENRDQPKRGGPSRGKRRIGTEDAGECRPPIGRRRVTRVMSLPARSVMPNLSSLDRTIAATNTSDVFWVEGGGSSLETAWQRHHKKHNEMADVAYRNKIVAKNIAKRQAENQMPFRGFMTGHPKDSLMGLGFREVDDHDEDPTGVVGSKQSGDRSESCKGGATEANDSDLRLSKSSEEEVVESFCQVKKEGVRVMDEGKNAGTKPESSQQVTKDGYTVAEALRVEAVILLNSRRRGMLLANQVVTQREAVLPEAVLTGSLLKQLNWATDITRKTKSAPVAGSTIAGELTCGAEAAANDERAVTAPMADGAIAKLMSDPNVVAECSVRIRSPTAVATPAQEANSASSLASSGTNKCVDMERDSPCTTPVKLASALVSIKSDYSAEEGSVVPSKGTRDNTKIRNKTDLVLRVPLTMVDVLQDRQNRFAELKPFTGATWVPVHRT